MKKITQKFAPPLLAALLASLSGAASAVEVYGGTGIGFTNSDSQWVANFVFSKQDAKSGASASIKTGDDVTPAAQKGNGTTITVPRTKSMAWCDPSSNPDNPSNTDFDQCYGWGMHSKWVVVDLNDLQKRGMTNVWVSVTAKRASDGTTDEYAADGTTPLPSDDDLVPALTVFQGRQDVGAHLHWYPNKFQKQTFWAWKLTPFAGGKTESNGWATGYFSGGNLDSANVTGKVKLKPGGQNYLSIAVGGDARHGDTKDKHDVNFELVVSVSKKKPSSATNSGSTSGGSTGGGAASGNIDKCGCTIGVTQWHPAMNHCMEVSKCDAIKDNPDDHCKTPAMCEADGGR
jgi:hypothetical protein